MQRTTNVIRDRSAKTERLPATPVVRNAPIHDQVLPHIRRDIIENRWKPGSRLPEPLLCKEFGISRTPLRQALKSLEAEGLVQLVPNVGAIVTDPDVVDVGEKMELLIALEQFAASRVAQSCTTEIRDGVKSIYHSMQDAAAHGDMQRYYDLNDDFHRAIVSGTGNATLIALHEKIMWHVHRERHRANEGEPFSTQAADNHEGIVRNILVGKPQEAGTAMRRHLENVRRIMLARRAKTSPL
jgi:DNA-binding GntR family transcriptional regulator